MTALAHRLAGFSCLTLHLVLGCACVQPENVSYHDHGELLYSSRVQWRASEKPFRMGVEAGYYGVSGDVTTNFGQRDYEANAGYGAFLIERDSGRADISGRVGFGYSDIDIAGQLRRISEQGMGFGMGVEGGYELTSWSRVYGHGFSMSDIGGDWSSLWTELGIELRPAKEFGLRVAYGYARNEANGQFFFLGADQGKVSTDGVLIGMTFRF